MVDIKSQKGITLVELLVVLVIVSIISILIVNFISSTQRTYISQQSDSFQLAETTIFFNMIMTDIKKNPNTVKIASNIITINEGTANSITYKFDNADKIVYRNENEVLNDVKTFSSQLENGNKLLLEVSFIDDKKYETIYFLRKGD